MIKKIWNLLREDPSKPVPNEKVEPTYAELIEEKEVVKPPSLREQLSELQSYTRFRSSTSMSDFQITNISHIRGNNNYVYNDGYYFDSNECYSVGVKLNGWLIFHDIFHQDYQDRYRGGKSVINIGDDEMEKSFVDSIDLEFTIEESSYRSDFDSIIIKLENIIVKRTLSDQSDIKAISNDFYSKGIRLENNAFRIKSRVENGSILRGIKETFPYIKKEIENDFREEVKNTKYQIKLRESLKEFDSKINENSLRDCFAYALDEDENSSISLMGINSSLNGRLYPQSDLSKKYWEVSIGVGNERVDGGNQINITDKSSNILFEVNEGINRLRKIYDKSKIVLNFSDCGNIKINVFPIFDKPEKVESKWVGGSYEDDCITFW